MDWMAILKLDQVNVTGTTLDTRPLPDEDRDCCEEARIKYMIETGKYIIRSLEYYANNQGLKADANMEYLVRRHGPDWKTKFDENNDEDCIQAYEEEHGGTGVAQQRFRQPFNCDKFRINLRRLHTRSSEAALKLWEECERG